ncbi:MAG: peptidoglycan DD-metalloendopeptidase family protein [Desulfonatronovibrionaceae bacterium]
MQQYIPSYRKYSRISFKRKRSKKPFWISAAVIILLAGAFLMGFDFHQARIQGVDSTRASSGNSDTSEPQKKSAPAEETALAGHSAIDPESIESSDKTNKPEITESRVTISSGDTLMDVLTSKGLDRTQAHEIITSMQDVFNPRKIRQGHELILSFEKASSAQPEFKEMNLKLDITREIQVIPCPEQGFAAKEITRSLATKPARAEAAITTSLYNAAIKAGIPVQVLMQMIRAFSFDVDFQRDIRQGDFFEIMYEEKLDQNGNFVRGGAVLYATLNTRGRSLPIYRYETSDGEVDFFDENGKSVRKTLMLTPVDGARLSSGYGNRLHPILGYNKMHKGLDFAAPTGTPIMAAGDGVVETVKRYGAYGNYIRIRHPNEFHTAYAHLSRYAAGIKSGVRVKQGEIIGYIGSTGRSTGPHLHYEVHHRGRHVNPSTVDTPPGRELKGRELERFEAARDDIKLVFASLKDRRKVASLD